MRNPAVNTGIGNFTNGSLLSSFVASESNRWHYLFCFIFFQTYEKFLVLSPVSDLKKIPSWYKTKLFIPSCHLDVSKEHCQTETARNKRAIREIPHFLRKTNVHYGTNKIHKSVTHLLILSRNYFETNITSVTLGLDYKTTPKQVHQGLIRVE